MSKYCPLCDRQVVPKKKVPWVSIVLLLVLVGWFYGVGVLIAIWLYMRAPQDECPICNAKVQSRKMSPSEMTQFRKSTFTPYRDKYGNLTEFEEEEEKQESQELDEDKDDEDLKKFWDSQKSEE